MSDLYSERVARCEEHRRIAQKINHVFKIANYYTAAHSALSVLSGVLLLLVGLMTAGHVAIIGITGLLAAICSGGVIWLGTLAAEDKSKRLILYEIILLSVKTVIADIATPELLLIHAVLWLTSAALWAACVPYCKKWEYLKQQECFPNFDTTTLTDERLVANTRGLGIRVAEKTEADETKGRMDEIIF